MQEPASKRLPPLNAVRVFAAAAEAGSFSAASRDLFVSPAAVSQQIRLLEDFLSTSLFIRTRLGVELTSQGQVYLTYVQDALQSLYSGQRKLQEFNQHQILTLTAVPSFASKWLMPKMFRWMDQHPEVEVRIEANNNPVDFRTSSSDFSIRFGDAGSADLETIEMFRDRVTPVCSPELLSRYDGNEAEFLLHQPLIHTHWGEENADLPSWQDWFNNAGLGQVQQSRQLQVNYSSMAIDAAVQGKGVMLGQMTMVQEELDAGKLVQVGAASIPMSKSYYLIFPSLTLQKPMVKEFVAWLVAQCEEQSSGRFAN